jgi:hypothetical protein
MWIIPATAGSLSLTISFTMGLSGDDGVRRLLAMVAAVI